MSPHYPGKLLEDYEVLLSYFPSHTICRPFVIESIRDWEKEYGKREVLDILEIGPGNGETTECIVDAFSSNLTLVEIDKKMCEELSVTLEETESTIEIVNEDATMWIKGVSDESYDVFTASWVIHNFPQEQRKEFLKEVKRVLRPSGLFVIFDKILPDDPGEITLLWNIHVERLQGLYDAGYKEQFNELLSHEKRDQEPPYVWYEKELIDSMNALGFKVLTFHVRNERDVVFSALK